MHIRYLVTITVLTPSMQPRLFDPHIFRNGVLSFDWSSQQIFKCASVLPCKLAWPRHYVIIDG